MTTAEQLRRAWCRAVGMDVDDMEESIRDDPPLDEEDEAQKLIEVLECEE